MALHHFPKRPRNSIGKYCATVGDTIVLGIREVEEKISMHSPNHPLDAEEIAELDNILHNLVHYGFRLRVFGKTLSGDEG